MTQQTALLLPMIGMIFLTFGIMSWMLKLRFRAVKEDGVNPRYFELYRGAKIPDYLAKVTQHYENLLEMPPLFYAAIILILVLNITNYFFIALAWCFFIFRLIHSFIHTGSNKLKYRKNAFIASTLTLMLLWISIAIRIITL